MTNLFARLPPVRNWNRGLLLVALTALIWSFDLVWDLLAVIYYPWQGTHVTRAQIGSHVVTHILAFPVLVLCYYGATNIPRRLGGPWVAFLMHSLFGFGFAALVRPILAFSVYLVTGDINAAGTHYHGLLEAGFSMNVWLLDFVTSLMVYSLGLFVILGLNARLDLENERIRNSQLYTLWLNARLDTLRSQLNPHFLFNSLHTISSLLFTDTRRADKLLADFSDVLRTTLREGQREFSTVREELDYARRYLSVEETRFEDRLITRFTVDERCLGARVPSLILQPLIENAIKHGISNSAGANNVTIEAARRGDTVVLEVSNDFRADSQPVSPERKMGIGLNNVRERLMAIYGADYLLSSSRLAGNRWATRVTLPFQEALWL